MNQLEKQAQAITDSQEWLEAMLIYEEQYKASVGDSVVDPALQRIGSILASKLLHFSVEVRCDTFCKIVPQISDNALLLQILITVTREARYAFGLSNYLLAMIMKRFQIHEEIKRVLSTNRYGPPWEPNLQEVIGGDPYDGYYKDALIATAKAAKAEYLQL